ncbi:MAG: hypothetical protein HZA94_00385 [Candidatus Vogelbacteria bacterium]|nr:hypothetical protein [Candidatus Vogelbacteria bacterium]
MPDPQIIPTKPQGAIIPPTTSAEATDTMLLAKKRLEAKLAMEGAERKRIREEEDRKRKQIEDLAKTAEEKRKLAEQERARQTEVGHIEQERERAEKEKQSAEIVKNVEEIKSGNTIARPVRTLRADMENLIRTNNISLVSMAIKEEERRRQNLESKKIGSKTNLTIIIISTLLILATVIIGIYLYLDKTGMIPSIPDIISPGRNQPKGIIPTETTKEIDITGKLSDEVVSRVIRDEVRYPENLLIGRTENLLLTKKVDGVTRYLTLPEFFTAINAIPPDQLARSLSSEFMFGVLSSEDNAGFLIVTTDSYNSAFGGLLEWEKRGMAKDLYQVLTTIKPEQEMLSKPFEDLTVKNIGTRILKDKAGTIRLVYAFLDATKTIVIAGSKETFLDALSRFQSPKPVRQ